MYNKLYIFRRCLAFEVPWVTRQPTRGTRTSTDVFGERHPDFGWTRRLAWARKVSGQPGSLFVFGTFSQFLSRFCLFVFWCFLRCWWSLGHSKRPKSWITHFFVGRGSRSWPLRVRLFVGWSIPSGWFFPCFSCCFGVTQSNLNSWFPKLFSKVSTSFLFGSLCYRQKWFACRSWSKCLLRSQMVWGPWEPPSA